jgi:hypothetical protein
VAHQARRNARSVSNQEPPTTPQVNVVVYVGDSRSREVIRAFEFPLDQGGCGVAGVARARGGGSKSRRFRFEVQPGGCGSRGARIADAARSRVLPVLY